MFPAPVPAKSLRLSAKDCAAHLSNCKWCARRDLPSLDYAYYNVRFPCVNPKPQTLPIQGLGAKVFAAPGFGFWSLETIRLILRPGFSVSP